MNIPALSRLVWHKNNVIENLSKLAIAPTLQVSARMTSPTKMTVSNATTRPMTQAAIKEVESIIMRGGFTNLEV